MLEEITQQLYEAVQEKKVCILQFKNEPLPRTVHPYGVCQSAHNKILIIVWQVSGYSKQQKAGYRSLPLLSCEQVEFTDKHFQVQSNFNPADPLYKDWVFHV